MDESRFRNTRIELGSPIKRLRVAQGLSQRKLALMIGMDYSYICNIENGRANASIDALLKIADGLGVRLRDLIP